MKVVFVFCFSRKLFWKRPLFSVRSVFCLFAKPSLVFVKIKIDIIEFREVSIVVKNITLKITCISLFLKRETSNFSWFGSLIKSKTHLLRGKKMDEKSNKRTDKKTRTQHNWFARQQTLEQC